MGHLYIVHHATDTLSGSRNAQHDGGVQCFEDAFVCVDRVQSEIFIHGRLAGWVAFGCQCSGGRRFDCAELGFGNRG